MTSHEKKGRLGRVIKVMRMLERGWMSVDALALELDVCPRTIQRYLWDIYEAGIVLDTRRIAQRGPYYRVASPPGATS